MKIGDKVVEELDAFSKGYEHVHGSVGPIVISMMRQAYNKGKEHQRHQDNNQDREYGSLYKKKTFNQWLKERFS